MQLFLSRYQLNCPDLSHHHPTKQVSELSLHPLLRETTRFICPYSDARSYFFPTPSELYGFNSDRKNGNGLRLWLPFDLYVTHFLFCLQQKPIVFKIPASLIMSRMWDMIPSPKEEILEMALLGRLRKKCSASL